MRSMKQLKNTPPKEKVTISSINRKKKLMQFENGIVGYLNSRLFHLCTPLLVYSIRLRHYYHLWSCVPFAHSVKLNIDYSIRIDSVRLIDQRVTRLFDPVWHIVIVNDLLLQFAESLVSFYPVIFVFLLSDLRHPLLELVKIQSSPEIVKFYKLT